MQNLIPLKKTLRLSRFSQNFTNDFFKNIQSFPSKDNLDNSNSSFQTDELTPTKKSIYLEENRISRDFKDLEDHIKENKEEDLFDKENSTQKTKFYEIQELKIYRETMLELPFLQEKPKKIKFKHICPEFVEFFFQIMKNVEFIQKIFASFISQEAITNEFAKMIHGFQLKKYNPGRTIEIAKDEEYFYIFVEGVTEKSTVKTASRLERKSFCESLPSATSLVRRSGLKNKTITSKGRVACFDGNLPLLVNEKEFNFCSLKTVSECNFLLLEKGVWNKFLIELQKLEEKHLVAFIKQWTTINLTISTKNELNKKDCSVERKTFLYDAKHPTSAVDSDEENDQIMPDKVINNERKVTIHGNAISSTYKLINMVKDEKLKIDNQNVYLIIKGSTFLTTNHYSIIINEGSIINTSILLNLQPETVQIKALTDCSIVKLILDEIYFKKEDESDFISKIHEIESFRNHINNLPPENSQISAQNNLNSDQIFSNSLSKLRPNIKNEKFEPFQLRVQDLNIDKTGKKTKKNHESRICHHYQTVKTEPCEESMKKVAVKFANNFCVFEKIVESKQKVSDSFKLNTISKIFPIKDLLENREFKKNLDLETDNSRKSTVRKTFVTDFCPENNNNCISGSFAGSFAASNEMAETSSEKKTKSQTNLKSLKKRREEFEKILAERKKKEKAKIIENLFYINIDESKMNEVPRDKNENLRFSAETHPDRLSEMIRRNSEGKFSEMQTGNESFDFFDQKKYNSKRNVSSSSKTCRGKFDGKFLVTEPNYSEIKKIEKIISGENLLNHTWEGHRITENGLNQLKTEHYISNEFLKMKKMTTRKIKTSMLNGRIRQSKGNI